uniref:SCP domain-containing protein n=1 Tax=Mesocestoides corti TaxID=53468 RepID=A0A5K3ER38_MESCO
MREFVFILAIIWHVTAPYAPSDNERRTIVEAHTKIRESVNPTASNMRMMTYSFEMEQLAETLVQWCLPIHQRDYPGLSVNQFASTDVKGNYEDFNALFAKQARHYDYRKNSCNRKCRAYTKVVWANSTGVGCAMNRCTFAVEGGKKPGDFVVCVYNSESSRKQRPYKKGASCSQCRQEATCSRNQCVTRL